MVKDIPTEQAQAVLVVESPHRDEVSTGIPLSGVSGRVVGRVLTGIDSPVGPLCLDGQVNLSVVNTFCQPMQFDIPGEPRPVLLKELESIQYEPGSYKNEIKRILRESQDRRLVDDYANRLSTALRTAASRKLVVCGFIAQAVFEWTFDVSVGTTRFTRPFSCKADSDFVEVFYVWHPSPRDGVSTWDLPDNSEAIYRLKRFVDSSNLLKSPEHFSG